MTRAEVFSITSTRSWNGKVNITNKGAVVGQTKHKTFLFY